MQARVRQRVFRWFVRQGYLDKDDAKDMVQWSNGGGGFSVDASVRVEADERAGLERLLRYCARPPFALERLETIDAHRLMYHLPKPLPDGRTQVILTPLELIQRLAALIPPPHTHRHRYHEVFAPNATLRAAVTALAPEASNTAQQQRRQSSCPPHPRRWGGSTHRARFLAQYRVRASPKDPIRLSLLRSRGELLSDSHA